MNKNTELCPELWGRTIRKNVFPLFATLIVKKY